ncbi:PilZ domain-containing protein [Geoalkalibacter sp.]|uniref:PilZ domain-containing protein n=1 Tax=Geoalkalibacter sp. TaxID=3041440 RepID=UPI00272EA77D|nr:PilZ domain-containing protein [Geoalkalibacter sp.]
MPKKILLAAADDDLLCWPEGFFHREEFTLLRARDAHRALLLVEQEEPALAVVGLDLAPTGGVALCRQIKKDFLLRPTRLVLLVPRGEEDRESCRASGADAILTLPVDGMLLHDTCRRLLNLPDPGRLARRAALRIPLRYRRLPSGEYECGSTVNLSTGGLFLEAEVLYPRDSLLELVLDLSPCGGPLLKAQGRVAWVNHPEWVNKPLFPFGMGLELIDLPLGELELLEVLVSRRIDEESV